MVPAVQRLLHHAKLHNSPELSETPVKIDAQHAIAHNKVMIIDGETVITGSFNFTKAGEENNAENLLVIKDKELAERYIENWQEHDLHSESYMGRVR